MAITRKHSLPILSAAALLLAIFFLVPPIAQDPAYHNFADKRGWNDLANVGDVLSNIPYMFVGLIGIFYTLKRRRDAEAFQYKSEVVACLIAFIGIFLVGFGSGYYHLDPNNETLVWDRLPMTIGFMAIFSMIIMERINQKFGLILLPILLIFGALSVAFWHVTEQAGQGDLRPYALVQFFPIIAIPVILWRYKARYTGLKYLVWLIVWYLIAKLLEHFDNEIFSLLQEQVSGHTLKHLASAIGTYYLALYIKHRTLKH